MTITLSCLDPPFRGCTEMLNFVFSSSTTKTHLQRFKDGWSWTESRLGDPDRVCGTGQKCRFNEPVGPMARPLNDVDGSPTMFCDEKSQCSVYGEL